MSDTAETRLSRARVSLEGLSVADALGGFFEFSFGNGAKNRQPPAIQWHYTDDTQMALSIYAILRRYGQIDQDALAGHFADHREQRGYGAGTRAMLARIKKGISWRELTYTRGGGQGSWGNGGSMRIAPLGAYFADDLDLLVQQARLATEVTHAHPEALAGAMAVALAAAYAVRWAAAQKRPTRAALIEAVLPRIPDSMTRQGLIRARDLPAGTTVFAAAEKLGNGSDISTQRTVPLTLWCAGEWLDDYEEAIWQTINAGGDADTTAAIVGGIVAAYTGTAGISPTWIESRELLPDWAFTDND